MTVGDNFEDPGVEGRIILKLIIKRLAERMDWIDGDWLWVILSAVLRPSVFIK